MTSEIFQTKSMNSAFVYRWFALSGSGWGVMVFGVIIAIIVVITRDMETMLDWMLPICILLSSALIMWPLLFMAARTNQLKAAFAEHGGKTCPFCMRNAWANTPCCSYFPQNWTPIDLDRYWIDRRQNNNVAKSVKRGDPAEPLGLFARRPLALFVITVSTAVFCLSIGSILWLRYPLMMATPMLFFFFLYIPGIPLVQILLMGNTDFQATGICSSCGHQQPPGDSTICSECGVEVDDSKVTPIMSRRRRLVVTVLGLAPFLTLICFLFLSPMLKAGAAANLSNSALIPLARTQTGFDQWAVEELKTRTLSQEEEELVFEAAMEQRRDEQYFASTRDLGPLVELQILAGTLSHKQLKTLRVGAWKSELIVPDTVEAGQTFTATLRGVRKEDFLVNNTGTTILFDGFSVDGGDHEGGIPYGFWTLQTDNHPDQGILEFDVKMSIDTPGTSRISALYWVLDRRYSMMNEVVNRNPDRTPIQPMDSSWMYPVVIEKDIEVRPAD